MSSKSLPTSGKVNKHGAETAHAFIASHKNEESN